MTTPVGSRMRFALLFGAIASLSVVTASCSDSVDPDQTRVVLYYSADEYVARPIIEEFERRTGVRVLATGDTEATKTTGLVQRLRAEKERPLADVFWSSEVFMTDRLAGEGLLAPHTGPEADARPEHLRDPDRLWHAFAPRARVVVFNADRLDAADIPTQLIDLPSVAQRGRIVVARPEFGTTRGHLGFLYEYWGEEAFRAWLDALRHLDVRFLDGNASVVRAVASGEADLGLTDTDDVWSGQRNGWNVDLIYCQHTIDPASGRGVMLIPNSVARVANGPNPEQAAQLVEYLLGADVERMLAESDSHNIPTRPELATEFAAYALPAPAASMNPSDVAEAMRPALRVYDEVFGG